MGWYNLNPKDNVIVFNSEDFIVDYNKSGKMYRVSVFEDCHFKDEFWFDAYEEKELEIQNKAVDFSYLHNWFIDSVGTEEPVWTNDHIEELLDGFIVIPKD